MNTLILPVKHPLLSQYVQSFLFFNKNTDHSFTYTTFANTNICLAIYKNNQVTYSVGGSVNHCHIASGTNKVTSRLYGFHKRPFTVDINGVIDQVCILFRPGALRSFTYERFVDLWQSNHVVQDLFHPHTSQLIDSLFTTDNLVQRADLVEQFLLSRLLPVKINPLLKTLFQLIEQKQIPLTISLLAASLHIDESTLYRLFMDHVGQSPKAYFQTVRFREALSTLLTQPVDNLTQLAYRHDYYDQAHYIKDIKQFSGYTPGQLQHKSSIEQNELFWITHFTRPA